jgi:hypothetical protein
VTRIIKYSGVKISRENSNAVEKGQIIQIEKVDTLD